MRHRVKHKSIRRIEDDEVVVYEVGDEYEPLPAELDAFGDRLEPAEVESPDATTVPETDLDEMGYYELQKLAREYDDINGNQSADQLRDQLESQR